MEPRNWNRPLAKRFLLGGEQRFPSALPEYNRGWILRQTAEKPSIPVLEPELEVPGTKFHFFQRFSGAAQPPIQSSNYFSTPHLEGFSWDWIEFTYQPQKDLEVRSVYWVPDPRVICGESWITNRKDQKRDILVDMVCFLQYQGTGNQILLGEIEGRPVLTGSLGNQKITLFLAGNPAFVKSPFPYLQTKISLKPDTAENIRWVCILSDTGKASDKILTTILKLDWPGEISRRKVILGNQIEIRTGDPNWDFTLAHSLNLGLLHYHQLISPGNHEEINPIQALTLLQALINPTADMVSNILDLVFTQREQTDQTPDILAGELLWQVHLLGFPKEIWFDFLEIASRWLGDWFSPDLDKDGDSIPELVNPRILDLVGSNTGALLETKNRLYPYPHLESPALGSLIYSDLCRIEDLHLISGTEIAQNIQHKKEILLNFLRDSWSSETNDFQNRDCCSHESVDGFNIIENLQPGLNILRKSFPQPSRIGVLHHRSSPEHEAGEFSIVYHGLDWRGNYHIEENGSENLLLREEFDWGISEYVYSKLDYCVLKTNQRIGQINLTAPSTSIKDITQTLPLWAGILGEQQTSEIVENILLDPDRYLSPYGFSANPGSDQSGMYLFWNLLLGQTLFQLGMNDASAELIERWMKAIIPVLDSSGSSYPGYGINEGQGLGKKDSLESLFPLRFFLQVLGIKILQNDHLAINGGHSFPWPVTLRYKGVEIRRENKQTKVIQSGKDTLTLAASENHIINLY